MRQCMMISESFGSFVIWLLFRLNSENRSNGHQVIWDNVDKTNIFQSVGCGEGSTCVMDRPVWRDFPLTKNWLWRIRRRGLWWLRGSLLTMSGLLRHNQGRDHKRAAPFRCRSQVEVPCLPGRRERKNSKLLTWRGRPSQMNYVIWERRGLG